MTEYDAFIAIDRRLALQGRIHLPDRALGAVLFADISGFTPLTEALAQELGNRRGAEELTYTLNRIYSALIADVHRYGGSVITFSGDAITCYFSADAASMAQAARRATSTALAMQETMSRLSDVTTPGGVTIPLAVKVAVVAGPVRRFAVGDPQIRIVDVLAGGTLDRMAGGEHLAGRGETLVAAEIAELLDDDLEPDEWREDEQTGVRYALVSELKQLADPAPWPADVSLDSERARPWLLPPVYDRLQHGYGHFIAELRPACSVFLSFRGIDYDGDDDAGTKLDAFLVWVQRTLARYEGQLHSVTMGDKGSYLHIVFGAPVSHADDPARAVAAALDLVQPPQSLSYLRDIKIGVSRGVMRAGAYGADNRQHYDAQSDKTNLAARLMQAAPSGEIYCEFDAYEAARGAWQFEALPAIRVKGKAGLIRIYRPTGETARERDRAAEQQTAIVGRAAELARMSDLLGDIANGQSHILFLEGEAGIGKSRLVEELFRMMRERNISGLLGAGQSIEQHTPYRVWRDLFVAYFGLEDVIGAASNTPAAIARRERIIQELTADLAPEQAQRLPLLNELLNLTLPENELTQSLDAALRQQNIMILLTSLLKRWAAEKPLALVLDDAHWLDDLSWDLTIQAARTLQVAGLPFLLMLVHRPLDAQSQAQTAAETLRTLNICESILVDTLSPEETVTLVARRLGLSVEAIPKTVSDLVRVRADGNPFYAEELIFTLRDQGVLRVTVEDQNPVLELVGDLDLACQTLPDTIQGLILARIDRQPPERQLLLKIGAVIGRTFAITPLQIVAEKETTLTADLLAQHLEALETLDFTPMDAPEPDLTYVFKHIITHDVAYETLLFAQRRQLHRDVAEWYETNFGSGPISDAVAEVINLEAGGDALTPFYPLLAYHYGQGEDTSRERFYSARSGALAAGQYANEDAVRYFTRALELTAGDRIDDRFRLLLERERVLDWQSRREEQALDLAELSDLAGDNRESAEVNLRLASYGRWVGDYPAALAASQTAVTQAKDAGDAERMAQGYFWWGRVLRVTREYAEAERILQQARAIAREHGLDPLEADVLLELGILQFFQGAFSAAEAFFQQALALFAALNDLKQQATGLINLGMLYGESGRLIAAQETLQQALDISRKIGYRTYEATILGNLGAFYAEVGDFAQARAHHNQALQLSRELGDLEGESFARSNLTLVLHRLHDNEAAVSQAQTALALHERLGDRRSAGYTRTYLGHALSALGEYRAAADAYDQALEIREALEEQHLMMDDYAGLARVALASGDETAALAATERILTWIEGNEISGIEYPLEALWTCYQTLEVVSSDDPSFRSRADQTLTDAHAMLQQEAGAIDDPQLRQAYLNISYHVAIADAWQAHNAL